MFAPVIVQQNSVYPSQQSDPHWQDEPLQLQIAPYAVPGRSTKSVGATASAVPTMAVRLRKLRRFGRRATNFAARSARRAVTVGAPVRPAPPRVAGRRSGAANAA